MKSRYTDATFTGTAGACAPTSGSCSLVDTANAQTSVGKTKCWATADDPGWFYEYGGPVKACADFVNTGCRNEKTGASASIVSGCTLWAGFQPASSRGGTDPCRGTVGLPLVFDYASARLSGTPSGTWLAAGYGVLYSASAMALAAFAFERRDLH